MSDVRPIFCVFVFVFFPTLSLMTPSKTEPKATPTKRENKLTTQPIPALIRQIAIPASVGFFFNTMYNVVDTWYASISQSTYGQAALTFSFPVFLLIISISSGLGTATNVLVSNALGEEDDEKAQNYISQAFGLLI